MHNMRVDAATGGRFHVTPRGSRAISGLTATERD
jgi:hypothetical protein